MFFERLIILDPTFGSILKGRVLEDFKGFRYGFNNQEKDDEIIGAGNTTTAAFWEYDTRLGRRWNLDPKPDFSVSNYATFADNPIFFVDVLGDVIGDGKIKVKSYTITPEGKFKAEFTFEGKVSEKQKQKLIEKFNKKEIPVIEAMAKTDGGQKNIKYFQDIPTVVSLEISKKTNKDAASETIPKDRDNLTTDNYYKEAKIVFYKGSIEKGGNYQDVTEGVNVLGAHEKVHLEPSQIILDKQVADGIITEIDAERYTTYKSQLDAIKEYRAKFGDGGHGDKIIKALEKVVKEGVWPDDVK